MFSLESHWHPLRFRHPAGVPRHAYRWLSDSGSLTRALVSRCNGRFSVEVVSQGWDAVLPGERRLLAMRRGEAALVREVRLHCDGEAWVFARTLIPASSLRGEARRLAFLGNRPLGAVLFADPTTRRRLVEFTRLKARHRLHGHATAHLGREHAVLWGRRTLFEYAGRPLLVNEIFLPPIPPRRAA